MKTTTSNLNERVQRGQGRGMVLLVAVTIAVELSSRTTLEIY